MFSKIEFFSILLLVNLWVEQVHMQARSDINECMSWKKSHIYEEMNYMLVYNFYSFKDLENECNQSYTSNSTVIEFLPKIPNKLILNEAFRVKSLANTLKHLEACILLDFKGVQIGFARVGKRSYLMSRDYMVGSRLLMAFSQLEFYLDDDERATPLSQHECTWSFFNRTNDFIFSKFLTIQFINVKYPSFICPFVFRHLFLKVIRFGSISNSLLNRNRLNFLDIDEDDSRHFNSIKAQGLEACTFNLVYDAFDKRLMNKFLFENLTLLVITGIVDRVDEEIFKSLKMLTKVFFSLDNLGDFFHQENSNKWMRYLNDDVRVNLENFTDIEEKILKNKLMIISFDPNKALRSFNRVYTYPDEDFCLFKHFPHRNLVTPKLVIKAQFECTCTFKFLIRYNWILSKYERMLDLNQSYELDFNEKNSNYVYNYVYLNDFNETEEYCSTHLKNYSTTLKCDFEKMLEKCNFSHDSTVTVSNSFRFNSDPDVLYFIKWFQLIFTIILQPILCLIGIFFNLIVILVVKSRMNGNLFKDKMYSFIVVNAVFNIAYCLIMILKVSYFLVQFCRQTRIKRVIFLFA
jgi:hypothetical protein